MANKKKIDMGIGWCSFKKKIDRGRFVSYEGVECDTDNPRIRNIKFTEVILHKKGSLKAPTKWRKTLGKALNVK